MMWIFHNQNIRMYQLVRHSPAITMFFSCFLYHFRTSYQTLDDTFIALSFLKVLVIDLSMFLVVKTEV